MAYTICTAVNCSRTAFVLNGLCPTCSAKRQREITALTSRWAKAHAEGRLSPEDREDIREGVDSTLEEYAILDE